VVGLAVIVVIGEDPVDPGSIRVGFVIARSCRIYRVMEQTGGDARAKPPILIAIKFMLPQLPQGDGEIIFEHRDGFGERTLHQRHDVLKFVA